MAENPKDTPYFVPRVANPIYQASEEDGHYESAYLYSGVSDQLPMVAFGETSKNSSSGAYYSSAYAQLSPSVNYLDVVATNSDEDTAHTSKSSEEACYQREETLQSRRKNSPRMWTNPTILAAATVFLSLTISMAALAVALSSPRSSGTSSSVATLPAVSGASTATTGNSSSPTGALGEGWTAMIISLLDGQIANSPVIIQSSANISYVFSKLKIIEAQLELLNKTIGELNVANPTTPGTSEPTSNTNSTTTAPITVTITNTTTTTTFTATFPSVSTTSVISTAAVVTTTTATTALSATNASSLSVKVLQIAAGFRHTCALMSETGGVRCWGYNGYGQLGDGNTTDLHSPPGREVLTGAVQITAGFDSTCALMSGADGARCWGRNDDGELGDGTTTDLYSPPSSNVLTGVAQVSAGSFHACVLLLFTGGVQCWGLNTNGQVGDGSMINTLQPTASDALTGVAQIAAGNYFTCALMNKTGGVRCWGYNGFGQLGDGTTTSQYSAPNLDVLISVAQIAVGASHTCALMRSTGGVRCWGFNVYGQLGDGTTTDLHSPPSSDALTGVTQIATGFYHTCALMNGTEGVRCWGYNADGELGDGSTTDLYSPPSSDVLTGVMQIAAGAYHTCALMGGTGGVRCWGLNDYGQLGDGTTANLQSAPNISIYFP